MKRLKQTILYSTVAFLLTMWLFVSPVLAIDATKTQGILMDWTLLDDTAATSTVETGELDSGEGLDAALRTVLLIDMAHCNSAAADTAGGWVIFIKSGTTEETWHEFLRVTATLGTANVGDCNDTTASGQAIIELTSTTNFETPGDVYFLHDASTIADSCLVIHSGSYNDDNFITVIDNLVNAYDADDNLYDIVDSWPIVLPTPIQAAKVLFYNTDADANYACRVHYTIMTDIE